MHYCPKCGEQSLERAAINLFKCAGCSFVYYHNTASAVGALIIKDGRVAVGIRAREPSKGMWDFPGGFIDPGESLEEGLARELQEELGQTPSKIEYFASIPNVYPYRKVTYNTCDVYFLCEFENTDAFIPADDITALKWVDIQTADLDQCAFESTRKAFKLLQSRN